MVDKDDLKNAICNNNILFLEENKNEYSINERFEDEDNDTLLLYSISDNFSNAYDFFLKNGADYTLVNDEGENIIHSIVFSGDNERLKKIIRDLNVNLNHQTIDGTTPLLLAISLEKNEIANTLLGYGADVKISDVNGITPLHLASQMADVEIVKSLIKHGADLFLKTKSGNLPLALAVNSENDSMVKYLYSQIYPCSSKR